MKLSSALCLAFVCLCVGLVAGGKIGNQDGIRIGALKCEQGVIDSIIQGKSFVFLNGYPVVIHKTVRSDKSIRYRAMSAAEDAEL